MYLFLPALTPILVLIACTQTNTTPYVVVSGVELFSDTFTVQVLRTPSTCTENEGTCSYRTRSANLTRWELGKVGGTV